MTTRVPTTVLALLVLSGCGPDEATIRADERRLSEAATEAVLDRELPRIMAHADSIEDALQPVALLTGGEEGVLRRFLNAEQLVSARRYGVDPVEDSASARGLLDEGRLVELEDSTEWWVVREMTHSMPLVVPSTRVLLEEIGRRFHARLDSLGVPRVRFEITSGLRTAASQASLRRGNANATGGTSTHEFGTTVDVAYAAYSAPGRPVPGILVPEAAYLERALTAFAAAAVEAAAARKSRELQAILGRVLEEMQDEGSVMVTMERGQPVYHMTVSERLVDG